VSAALGFRQTSPDVVRELHGCQVLVIRGDGKGYYGRVEELYSGYFELTNGRQTQNIYYMGPPSHIAEVHPPAVPLPKLADPRLL